MTIKITPKTKAYMGIASPSKRIIPADLYVRSYKAAKLGFPSKDKVSGFWDKLFGKDKDIPHHVDEAEFIYDKQFRYDNMDSSMVDTVEYNPDEKAMLVGFRSDSALYMFFDVSEWVFDRIVSASSHGKMFWRLIRRTKTKYKRIR